MKYPTFIKKDSTIGICAPSAGVGKKLESFDLSLSTLKDYGFKLKETESVRINGIVSADGKTRADELKALYEDDEVDMVMCAAGGDFLNEMLPYVDFDCMKKNPKWLMGHSDPTGLLLPLTVNCDVASIYGLNAGGYDILPLPKFIQDNLEIIQGDLIVQESFPKYMKTPTFLAEKIEFDTPVKWESSNTKELNIKARCIGGCMDCMKDMIGTPYLDVQGFVERYKEDGQIWYFDVFSMSAENFYRTLCQMKYAGWFKYTKAVLVGRVLLESSETGMTYKQAIEKALSDIPTIYNVDIGHTLPHMTMINGAMMHLQYKEEKGTIEFKLI